MRWSDTEHSVHDVLTEHAMVIVESCKLFAFYFASISLFTKTNGHKLNSSSNAIQCDIYSVLCGNCIIVYIIIFDDVPVYLICTT